MVIVCGTDFSPGAEAARAAAAALASRLPGAELWLVHVLEPATKALLALEHPVVEQVVQQRLEEEAGRLAKASGVSVRARCLGGDTGAALLHFAEEREASLVIVSSRFPGTAATPRVGRTPERLLRETERPVLVVRDAAPFEAWARRERPLRLLLSVDWTASSEAAIGWVKALRAAGPCDVTVGYVSAPDFTGDGARRYGILPRFWARDPDAEVESLLRRDLEKRVGALGGAGTVAYRPLFGLGSTADQLVALADREQVDLLVLGAHQRRRLARLGSVSSAVLQNSHASVVICPASEAQRLAAGELPRLTRVVIGTDFSPVANHAVPYGYALLPEGGDVLLLHVDLASALSPTERTAALARLQALVPAPAAGRGIVTRTEVVGGANVAEALCEAAERFGADALCVSSHGRSGVARTLLGSVAESVLRRSRLPVLVTRPPPP